MLGPFGVRRLDQDQVGRKTRRAQDVANNQNSSAPVLSRSVDVPPAGFEYLGERLHQVWWKPHAWLKTGAD
jgi:hypothetical protein